MAELIRLALNDLHRGERLRPVDMDVAAAIGASFEERGQISPITVRRTPAKNKGATPYTLITGGHRCAAADIVGWTKLDAIVVEADGAEAQLMEIAENIYRNELCALDRAIFVLKYRELWEEAHGKIDRTANLKVGQASPKGTECPSGIFAPGRELSRRVQERLGFGETTYKKVTRIGQNLHPVLRAALRGTGAETDQSKLLKLAKLAADDQLRIAASLKEKPDLKLALSWLKPEKPTVDVQQEIIRKVVALLGKADYATLAVLRETIDEKLDRDELEDAA